ncbi:MAG: class I SAM-dependent methyltransferase [Gammaproteobacteria bacterium]
MDFIDFITIIERDHTYQNPTSMAKLDLLVEYCQIEDGHRVLDIGCGKGWLLQRIAEQFAVKADGVELNPAFIKEGKDRLARAPQGRDCVSSGAGEPVCWRTRYL